MSVGSVNAAFPKYPMTVDDKGWIYGVWYCGTSWDSVRLHGQYPPTFLKRAMALFPAAQDVLHVPSGTLICGITVDRIVDAVRRPRIQADAASLPFRSASFDLVISDPPYTDEDSKKYGCKPYPLLRAMKEHRRVLRTGGHLGVLHTFYPSYKRKEWRLRALIAVVTGFMRATRMFSVFEKLPDPPPDRGGRESCARSASIAGEASTASGRSARATSANAVGGSYGIHDESTVGAGAERARGASFYHRGALPLFRNVLGNALPRHFASLHDKRIPPTRQGPALQAL